MTTDRCTYRVLCYSMLDGEEVTNSFRITLDDKAAGEFFADLDAQIADPDMDLVGYICTNETR